MIKKLFSTLFIDIRGEIVRVVQGKTVDSNLNILVEAFGTLELPGNGGPNPDPKLLKENAARLKAFLREQKINAARVVAGLGLNGIIARNVRVPKLEPKDLDQMMNLEINDYLPVSRDEYIFDYKVLDEVEEDERCFLDLIVAAVNTKQAEHSTQLFELAGLKPVVLDILPNMMHRLFGFMSGRDIMVLDGGREGTHLSIFKGKSLFMYADIPFIYNREDSDISVLASEMRGYLDFFSSRNFGKNVDSIIIVGELAEIDTIQYDLGYYVAVPVSVGLEQAGMLTFKGCSFADHAALYAGNLGLMMRGKDHKSTRAVKQAKAAGIDLSENRSMGTGISV